MSPLSAMLVTLAMLQEESAAQGTTDSGLQFAIAGYVIGLVLLLGYGLLLWRALTRRASSSNETNASSS